MAEQPTAAPSIWDELAQAVEAGRRYDTVERAEREQLVARLDALLADVRRVERELEEIRDELHDCS